MRLIARAFAMVIALLCAITSHAAVVTPIPKDVTVKLMRGSFQLVTDPRNGAPLSGPTSVLTATNCAGIRDAIIDFDGLTRETGANVYKCVVEHRAMVTFRQNPPPTCGDRPGPNEQAQRTCPAGSVGTWLQDRVWTLRPYPDCWIQGDWTPSAPPEGMCAPADSDGDGVPDSADQCPTVYAVTPNGCPATPPDADRDGVPDATDRCPSVPAATDDGCPVIEPHPLAITRWATPTGSSSSECSQSVPCSLQRALVIARAGDTVDVAAGVYSAPCTGNRYMPAFQPANSGTSVTQQIAFIGRGGTTTELRCASGAGPVIGTYSRRWIVWDGFFVDESRSPSVSDTGPAVVWSSDWVTLRNLVIRGAAIARDDNHTGIRIEQSRDIAIDGNTITGIRETRSPSQNFAGIMGYDAIRVTVNGNTISDCDVAVFPKGDHNFAGYGLGEWRITGNRISAHRAGMQIGGLKSGTGYGRSVISNNVIIGPGAAGLAGIQLHAYDGISPRAIDIHHNTVTGFGAAVLATTPGGAQSQVDITIRDNVLVGATIAINIHWTGSRPTFASDYNLLWPAAVGSRGGWYTDGNTRDTLTQWRSATANDAHSISVDPALSSDFKLPSNSAGRTAGSSGGLIGAP